MRFVVVVVSAGAALAFIAASGLMNWVFMTSLGKSDFEQQIFGAVSVAVSAFIALLPTLILWAWRDRRLMQAAVGLAVFAAFVAFSLSSAVGFSAKNRGSIVEDRSTATTRLAEMRRDIEDAKEKRKALGNPRPVAVIQEAVRTLELDRNWKWSKECQSVTLEGERTFCKGYFDLKAEAARSAELLALDAKLVNLKSEARGYEAQGAGRESDSQAAVLASLLGLQAVKVERGMTLFLALLVEVGAALGLYLALGHVAHRPVQRQEHHFPDAGKMVVVAEPGPVELKPVELKRLEAPRPQLRRVPAIRKS